MLKPLVHSDPYDSVLGTSPYPEVESLLYVSACDSDILLYLQITLEKPINLSESLGW